MSKKLATLAVAGLSFSLPAFAQETAASPSIFAQLLFFLPMILIFYFLLIRPQQQRQKKHRLMIEAVKRGDTVVTSGGIVGKVTKVAEHEATVEIAENVRVKIVKSMIIEVRGKDAPVAAND